MSFEVELPSAFLDSVIEDTTEGLTLVNRSPEPNETSVPVATLVELDIICATASGNPDLTKTKVYIEGVLAFDAGTFQPSFGGASSAYSNPAADTLRIIIDYTAAFTSLQVVDVRVVSESTVGGLALDSTYSFTCADVAPPILVTVEAVELSRVRVTFDEPVTMTSDSDGALNAANWEFERLTVPAVNVVASSVEQRTDRQVDVLTDIPLTPGATYRIYGTNFTDLAANVIVAPFNQREFVAFTPPKPAGRKWDLLQMVPLMNRQEDITEDLRKFIACLQEVTDLLLFDVDSFTDMLDPDLAAEQYVDAMLADLGNPFAFDLSEVNKRRLVQVLVDMYQKKGTPQGIVEVILFFMGLVVEVDAFNFFADGLVLGESELGVDWTLGPSLGVDLYSFNVISAVALTETQRKQIRTIVEYMKPAHTHFITLVEPEIPVVLDHVELGLSELGVTWDLH